MRGSRSQRGWAIGFLLASLVPSKPTTRFMLATGTRVCDDHPYRIVRYAHRLPTPPVTDAQLEAASQKDLIEEMLRIVRAANDETALCGMMPAGWWLGRPKTEKS